MQAFPFQNLLPKNETEAATFIAEHPEYDGRNTVIAILDTGVDPAAVGLRRTSDGKPKIIDVIDATGAGNVNTATIVQAQIEVTSGNSYIQIRDKKVYLNPDWPQNSFHVGVFAGYDVFPAPLKKRLEEERKNVFLVEQKEIMSSLQLEKAQLLTETSERKEKIKEKTEKERVLKDLTQRQRELDARISVLEDIIKNYEDPGPIYDCIVFQDKNSVWRAVIDVEESGDLRIAKAMADFRLENEFGTFSNASQLNYAVNVYDNGNILSVVCDSGAHGTHVAAITAAFHPEQPELNGIAPGAQIISIKIGDVRLQGMETSASLSRALHAVRTSWKKIDIINMSYGEYSTQHNIGRFIELAQELVDEHHITFVASAGNNGPAIGTVGAPGGTSSCILGVGAYVSPDMMQAEYALRENDLIGIAYTWSSRGPTFDGDMGVSICAPGAAITSVPNWTLNSKQLMNGTSMSSPNCAGNIALLISALKDKKIAYTPYSIRRSLTATAKAIENVETFAQGSGLLQIRKAYHYLEKHNIGSLQEPMYYSIQTKYPNVSRSDRGIFIYSKADFSAPIFQASVTVQPIFYKYAGKSDRVRFEAYLELCASHKYVDVTQYLAVMQSGRSFQVAVRTDRLSPGHHYAEIRAIDTRHRDRKSVLTIPICVFKPLPILKPEPFRYCKHFSPGTIQRQLFMPPKDANWAQISISRRETSNSNSLPLMFLFHSLQMVFGHKQSENETQKYMKLTANDTETFSIDVNDQFALEICVAQVWRALGDCELDIAIDFHGIVPNEERIDLYAAIPYSHDIRVRSTLYSEVLTPKVSFTQCVQRLRPISTAISPVTLFQNTESQAPNVQTQEMIGPVRERQTYQLLLEFSYTKITDKGLVIPFLTGINGPLYENPFDAQMTMVFDAQKRYLGASDAFGTGITLEKGQKYILRTQICHESLSALENLQKTSLVMRVTESLSKEITAHVYSDPLARFSSSAKTIENLTLPTDLNISLFVQDVPKSALLDDAAGLELTGLIRYGASAQTHVQRPSGYRIRYHLPSKPATPSELDAKEEKSTEIAVRDLVVQRLEEHIGKSDFEETFAPLQKSYPDHLPLLLARVRHFHAQSEETDSNQSVLEAAKDVLTRIDESALSAHFGTRSVPKDEQTLEQKTRDTEKNRERDILIQTLAYKTCALVRTKNREAEMETFQRLQRHTDTEKPTSMPVFQAALAHDRFHARYGFALTRVRALVQDTAKTFVSNAILQKELVSIAQALDWKHYTNYERKWQLLRNPTQFRMF